MARLEEMMQQKMVEEVTKALKEGESKGKRSVEERLCSETQRLKSNFVAVEAKFREAQKVDLFSNPFSENPVARNPKSRTLN